MEVPWGLCSSCIERAPAKSSLRAQELSRPLRVTLLGAFLPRQLLEDLVVRTAPPHRVAPSSSPRVAGCGCLATRTPRIGRYAMGKGIEPSLHSLVSRTAQRTLESTIFRFDGCASFWDFLARQRSPSAQCSECQHATVVSSTAVSARSACVAASAFVCSVAFRVRMRPEPCRMSLVGAQYERLCMLASFGM